MNKKLTIAILLFTCNFLIAQSQKRLDYIEKYKDLAIAEMKLYGIPASIKMAQAILESGDGQSHLAKTANNHFGIKCHLDWTGAKVYHDDDEKGECFRKYKKVEESYRDHSLFLKERVRYAKLFTLDPTDYKAWAKGLKEAGYATNPKYPDLLIKIIEDYELFKLDQSNHELLAKTDARPHLYHANRIKYIIAEDTDSYEKIAKDFKISLDRLLKYNEVNYTHVLRPGDYVFLQPKRSRAVVKTHIMGSDEDLYEVSQRYGIKLKYVYKKNKLKVGEQLNTGDTVYLKKTKK